MKVSDFIFKYPSTSITSDYALCRVRIFVTSQLEIYAILTDLGEKSVSSSVTNSVEFIRLELMQKGFIPASAKVIEHYDKEFVTGGSFDFVSFDENNRPSWKGTGLKTICQKLEVSPEEFLTHSLEIKELYEEIERQRHEIDPHLDAPYPESYEVINRREDIQSNMLTEGKISQAIADGSGELELQDLIKSDLSILGDFYALPSEEYICFSEFPLGGGFVDFVVFSGRSRMDVTLIEIKGANYNLINGNNYADFSAKTNQAAQQIRTRLGYITRNPEEFRLFVHKVRESVESGEQKYNSFIGPKGALQVDPNKDICLFTVVIGGRSQDDIKESRLRHDYERGTSPSIKIESWDSWINKSTRK